MHPLDTLSWTKDPVEGLFSPSTQPLTSSAIWVGLAQVVKSESGIPFRF